MKLFLLWLIVVSSVFRLNAQPGSVGAWNSTTTYPYWIEEAAAVAFEGRIYVLGGYASGSGLSDFVDSSVRSAIVNANGTLGSWMGTSSFANGRQYHAAAVDPGTRTMYVVGGENLSNSKFPDVQYTRIRSDGTLGNWAVTTSLPNGLSGHKAFCHNGYLYVFRAKDQFVGVAQGYYYSPIKADGSLGDWTLGTFSFTRGRYFGAFAYNDHFYIVGGDKGDGSTVFNQVKISRVPQRSSLPYLQLNEAEFWQNGTPLPIGRTSHGTAAENGFIYVVGGKADLNLSAPDRNDVLFARVLGDGSLESWQTTSALPVARSSHGCVAHRGYVYVIGGDVPGSSGGLYATDSVLYAPILSSSDTTPPKTQITPSASQQTSTPVRVTLTATDVGGSGVVSIRRTTDGTDPRTSGSAVVVNSSSTTFLISIPATLKVSATDAAGNAEIPQAVSYTVGQTGGTARKFRWPVSGRVTQDFYDDYSGIGAGNFRDDLNQWRSRVREGVNLDYAKSLTHISSELNWDSNGDGVFDAHMHKKLHRGIDISATGDVRPALGGTAYRYDWNGNATTDFYGNRVVIDHGAGYYTLYAHLASFSGKLAAIANGQSVPVEISDVIGQVGKTAAAAIHLHFEIRHSPDSGGGGYGTEAHFIPVPSSLSVSRGTEIPLDYPGLGGSALAVSMVNSGGLTDFANTSPTISASGTTIAFKNSPVFHVVDVGTGSLLAENSDGDGTMGNGELFSSVFSADSTVKAFASDNSNLVADDSNDVADVFVWTQMDGATDRVSVSSAGEQANGRSYDVGISADGRFVVFTSVAANLVANDTNQTTDIFLRDRATSQTYHVSVDSNGVQGNGPSYSPSISADSRFVAFISESTNLVPGDSNGVADVFVRDTQFNTTVLVSRAWNGAFANGACRQPSISGDGRYIAYESDASNLVPGDSNGFSDVFLYDSATGNVQKLSTGPNGEQANGSSHNPRISSYGLRIAFTSEASNLSQNDTNGMPDVFVAGFSAPPLINVSTVGNQIVLSWPTSQALFNLESTSSLDAPASWSAVLPAPTTVGDEYRVTNTISAASKFYRLKK